MRYAPPPLFIAQKKANCVRCFSPHFVIIMHPLCSLILGHYAHAWRFYTYGFLVSARLLPLLCCGYYYAHDYAEHHVSNATHTTRRCIFFVVLKGLISE